MKKILNTKKYDWILPLVLLIIFVIALVCFLVLYVPYQNANSSINILVICIISILIAICLICFLFAFQFVILNEKGITFRCLICKFGLIRWEEIQSLSFIKLNTSSSIVGMKYYHYFIEIQTKEYKTKFNKILYNKKNLSYLLKFIENYNNAIDISKLSQNLDIQNKVKWF